MYIKTSPLFSYKEMSEVSLVPFSMRFSDIPLFRVQMPFPIPSTTFFNEFAGICIGDIMEDGPIQEITMISMNHGNLFTVSMATHNHVRACSIIPFDIIEIGGDFIIMDMTLVQNILI